MMATQPYYGDSDYESRIRSAHRSAAPLDYYSRTSPYHYYGEQSHQDRRVSRSATRALIEEASPATPSEQRKARQRIAVACERCRKRKIKCSGDMGDGMGCNACRVAGANGSGCAFMRVGSKEIGEAVVERSERLPTGMHNPPQHHGIETSPISMYGTINHQFHGRPSIPSLHTRSSFPSEFDSPYESLPVDAYTYASSAVPRQDSVTSTYGNFGGYRVWTTNPSVSTPLTTTATYPMQSYSFGMLTAPSFTQPSQPQQSMTRLPSVTAESFSPLNMSQLNSSLPTHTMNDRRLPIPAPPVHQHPSNSERRLTGTYGEPRAHTHGMYGHDSVLWSRDTASATSRNGSIANLMPPIGQPIPSIQCMTAVSEASLGYQMANPTTESSETSPTSGSTSADDYASASSSSTASMPPSSATLRYSSSSGHCLPSIFAEERPATISRSSIGPSQVGLYSFSSESSETHYPIHDQGVSEHSEVFAGNSVANNSNYHIPLLHPQPQHVSTDAEAMARRACGAEYQPVLSTTQRMSLSNLSTSCAI